MIWWHRSGWTIAQVSQVIMAWCLTAPSQVMSSLIWLAHICMSALRWTVIYVSITHNNYRIFKICDFIISLNVVVCCCCCIAYAWISQVAHFGEELMRVYTIYYHFFLSFIIYLLCSSASSFFFFLCFFFCFFFFLLLIRLLFLHIFYLVLLGGRLPFLAGEVSCLFWQER